MSSIIDAGLKEKISQTKSSSLLTGFTFVFNTIDQIEMVQNLLATFDPKHAKWNKIKASKQESIEQISML